MIAKPQILRFCSPPLEHVTPSGRQRRLRAPQPTSPRSRKAHTVGILRFDTAPQPCIKVPGEGRFCLALRQQMATHRLLLFRIVIIARHIAGQVLRNNRKTYRFRLVNRGPPQLAGRPGLSNSRNTSHSRSGDRNPICRPIRPRSPAPSWGGRTLERLTPPMFLMETDGDLRRPSDRIPAAFSRPTSLKTQHDYHAVDLLASFALL